MTVLTALSIPRHTNCRTVLRGWRECIADGRYLYCIPSVVDYSHREQSKTGMSTSKRKGALLNGAVHSRRNSRTTRRKHSQTPHKSSNSSPLNPSSSSSCTGVIPSCEHRIKTARLIFSPQMKDPGRSSVPCHPRAQPEIPSRRPGDFQPHRRFAGRCFGWVYALWDRLGGVDQRMKK